MMDSKDFKIKWYYYIPIYGLFKLYIDGQGVVVTETKEFIKWSLFSLTHISTIYFIANCFK